MRILACQIDQPFFLAELGNGYHDLMARLFAERFGEQAGFVRFVAQHQGRRRRFAGIELRNESDKTGLLALQGPKAAAIMQKLTNNEVAALPGFHYGESTIGGIEIGFGRTGYTGEDGFEIFGLLDRGRFGMTSSSFSILQATQPALFTPATKSRLSATSAWKRAFSS